MYNKDMQIITIPKKLAEKGDLVVIPRREYEEFLELRRVVPVVKSTKEESRIIRRAEREIRDGEYKPWTVVKHELERRHNRKRRKAA
jgi:hypothetical protein